MVGENNEQTTNDDLKARMAEIENRVGSKAKKSSVGKLVAIGATALAIVGGTVFVVTSLQQPPQVEPTIASSQVQEFPDDQSASDRLELPELPRPIAIRQPYVPETDSATLARLQELELELEAAKRQIAVGEDETVRERELREELERERDVFATDIANLRSSAENDQNRSRETILQLQVALEEFRTELATTRAANIESEQEMSRRMIELQQEAMAREEQFLGQLREARAVDPLEQERVRLLELQLEQEAEDRVRLEERRAEQLALEQARSDSGLLAVNNTGAVEAGAGEGRELSANEAFVQRIVAPAAVSRSSQITSPQATVVQGTIIQAALETAVDSSLPGPIRAVVSEDVHSLDGSSILIPAGSKVFGEYSSGIALGQERVLVVWTRILTPSNRTVDIASFGGDGLGRSGTSGVVDTRFRQRFGGAAAISIIGALPAVAANRVSDEDNAELVEDVGDDFSSATDRAIGEYLSIPPAIYVHQGSSVSIILDRDLEIF